MTKGKRKGQMIGVAVLQSQGEVFLQLRRNTGHLDGFWVFPGGKVKRGETPLEAAVRETLEETGLKLDPREAGLLQVEEFPYPDRLLRLYFYGWRLPSPLPLPEGKWVPLAHLGQFSLPPANRRVVSLLLRGGGAPREGSSSEGQDPILEEDEE